MAQEQFPVGMLEEVIPWRYKFQRLWRCLTLYYRRHPAVINPPPPPAQGGESGVREPRRPSPVPPTLRSQQPLVSETD
jgi:hypothetical protein